MRLCVAGQTLSLFGDTALVGVPQTLSIAAGALLVAVPTTGCCCSSRRRSWPAPECG